MANFSIGSTREDVESLKRTATRTRPQDALADPELGKLAVQAASDSISGEDSGAFEEYVRKIGRFFPDPREAVKFAEARVESLTKRARSRDLIQEGGKIEDRAFQESGGPSVFGKGAGVPIAGPGDAPNALPDQALIDKGERFGLHGRQGGKTTTELLGKPPDPLGELGRAKRDQATAAGRLSDARTGKVPSEIEKLETGAELNREKATFLQGRTETGDRKTSETVTSATPGGTEKRFQMQKAVTKMFENNLQSDFPLTQIADDAEIRAAVNNISRTFGWELPPDAVVKKAPPGFLGFGGSDTGFDLNDLFDQMVQIEKTSRTTTGRAKLTATNQITPGQAGGPAAATSGGAAAPGSGADFGSQESPVPGLSKAEWMDIQLKASIAAGE